MVGAFPANATISDATYYANILRKPLYLDDGNEVMGSEFSLYDLNNDGRKELIVNGWAGSKAENVCIIYSPKRNKYVKSALAGGVQKVSAKGVYATEYSQSGAGMYSCEIEYVYQLDADGKAYRVLSKSTDWEYDLNAGKDRITGISYYKSKNDKDSKITKKMYRSALKKYKFKKVKMHAITIENIRKYVK